MYAERRAWCAGVDHDDHGGCAAFIFSVVPFVHHFDKGVAGLEVQGLVLFGDHRQLAADKIADIDHRVLMQRQLRASGDFYAQHADFRFGGGVGRQLTAIPAFTGLGQNVYFYGIFPGVSGTCQQHDETERDNGFVHGFSLWCRHLVRQLCVVHAAAVAVGGLKYIEQAMAAG